MAMPGRKYTASDEYRYGFNGKENDNEVKGAGNQQDYGMRIYDPRIGKFLSVDPLTAKYPMLTPYQFASNRPIDGVDLDGLEFDKESLNKLITSATTKLTNYLAEKVVNSVSSGMGALANYFNDHVEVTYYAKFEYKVTVGGRISNEFLKKSGILLSGDIDLGSVEFLSITGELNLKTLKFDGTLNYITKNDKAVFSKGVSGSFALPVDGIPVGVGAGGKSGHTSDLLTDSKTENSKSGNVGGGIGIFNLTGTSEKTTNNESGTSTTTLKASAGALNGSVGAGVVTEFNVLEVGAKVDVKQDE